MAAETATVAEVATGIHTSNMPEEIPQPEERPPFLTTVSPWMLLVAMEFLCDRLSHAQAGLEIPVVASAFSNGLRADISIVRHATLRLNDEMVNATHVRLSLLCETCMNHSGFPIPSNQACLYAAIMLSKELLVRYTLRLSRRTYTAAALVDMYQNAAAHLVRIITLLRLGRADEVGQIPQYGLNRVQALEPHPLESQLNTRHEDVVHRGEET